MKRPEPMIRVAPAIAMAKHFEAHNLDFNSAAASCGFPIDSIEDPMRTLPLRVVADLFVVASRAVGDCGLAIKVAEEFVASNGGRTTGLMGYLASAAPTVRVFLECIAGFAPLLVTGVEVGFAERGGLGKLFWRAPADFEIAIKPLGLFIAATLVHRVRTAAGPGWVPLAVTFEHKAPMATTAELGVFGSRVMFDAEMTSITVDAATLAKPMPTANPELFAIFTHHAKLLMPEIAGEADMVTQVRRALRVRIATESATLDAVAKDLGLPPRVMQRRLERLGLTFEKVLDDVRCTIAERLLRETDRPIMQVAHEVGYGSQSTFTRAVRRWLQDSPRAYRQRFRDQVRASNDAAKSRANEAVANREPV